MTLLYGPDHRGGGESIWADLGLVWFLSEERFSLSVTSANILPSCRKNDFHPSYLTVFNEEAVNLVHRKDTKCCGYGENGLFFCPSTDIAGKM